MKFEISDVSTPVVASKSIQTQFIAGSAVEGCPDELLQTLFWQPGPFIVEYREI